MFRCWWMTFMGRPRDEHVYHHAHEMKLMYVPLIVLAAGTVLSGWFLFRHLLSDAAPAATAAALVLPTDGALHTPAIGAAHGWLTFGVGFAFVVGFALAFGIYRHGLDLAERIRRAIWPVHAVLEHKYFFDEVYDLVVVKGCLVVAAIARFIDTWIIDLIFDLSAAVTQRLAAFSGLVLDNHGVDGVVNGVAKTSTDIGWLLRSPQTGRIRHYVLFVAAAATIVFALILMYAAGAADAAVVATG
jgi:NADH:ubiquinone oxidoreductase subunit 5 (subunit L)/multisubunit Na+/H+ antiporter MnhA subunit